MITEIELQYFLELARNLHMSRAAQRLGVTQPALSHALRRLEQKVGHDLFLRNKSGLKLTHAGQQLMEGGFELQNHWQNLVNRIHKDQEEVVGTIRVGCHTAVAQYTIPFILPELLSRYPQLNVNLEHGLSRHLLERIMNDQLEVGFIVNPNLHDDLIIREILKDQVCLWQSEELKNKDVLIADPSLLQTQSILQGLKRSKMHFRRIVESSSLEVIAQLVRSGAGYGILPSRVAKTLNSQDLKKVSHGPVFHDRICLVYKSQFKKSRRGQTFVEFVTQILKHG